MSTKHTPGPWRFEPATESDFAYVVLDGDAIAIQSENSDEDGRLIAAAPDLLDACQKAEEWLTGWASADGYIAVLRAAIAKATGATT